MSIASQLQVIRSSTKVVPESKFRPSVLFDPRVASDIDGRSILPVALSGLEVLGELDSRFRSYKDTLFSQTSLELDREKMVPKEEAKVNKSVCSFLRLLCGHLHLHAALKTLEYLIRHYLVHIYNMDELTLCALPFHDTGTFVRIVQLLALGNSKWTFLEGVKASGAPPPRKVIVQQCIRDKGLLESLCNYASPTKEFQHSRPVICFCTAVVVEALGAIPKLDTDTVQRILVFVFNGLNPLTRGSEDHKVLMQTRNEKIRPKILGLKTVKYLVEHLKEEYLVFLHETIPFLGELLEDVEPPVKMLAQDILKELETLSGESLRQYL